MTHIPKQIIERLGSLARVGVVDNENAVGRDANFSCGSAVRISLRIDPETQMVVSGLYQTNGCAFMVGAAEELLKTINGRTLRDLRGLDELELRSLVQDKLGGFDKDRGQCLDTCIEALHAAFSDFRSKQIEEFQGEKALICTCFGVTEETVELQIKTRRLNTVDEVTEFCDVGGGCGSCRMLIQELLDLGHGRN